MTNDERAMGQQRDAEPTGNETITVGEIAYVKLEDKFGAVIACRILDDGTPVYTVAGVAGEFDSDEITHTLNTVYQQYVEASKALADHEAREPEQSHPHYWGWWSTRNKLVDRWGLANAAWQNAKPVWDAPAAPVTEPTGNETPLTMREEIDLRITNGNAAVGDTVPMFSKVIITGTVRTGRKGTVRGVDYDIDMWLIRLDNGMSAWFRRNEFEVSDTPEPDANDFKAGDKIVWQGARYSIVRIDGDTVYLSNNFTREAGQEVKRAKVRLADLAPQPDAMAAALAEIERLRSIVERIQIGAEDECSSMENGTIDDYPKFVDWVLKQTIQAIGTPGDKKP